MEGRQLSEQQAQALEAALKLAPDDLSIRTKLMGYYWGQFRSTSARRARQQHVFWVIQNHPEAAIAGVPEGTLDPHLDGEAYEQAAALWKQQVAGHPADPAILGNAAAFFLLYDATLAENLLKKGEALEPANPRWPQRLGQLYSLHSHAAGEPDASKRVADALAAYERAYARTAGDLSKSYLLPSLAAAAFDAGSMDKAKSYADFALDAAKRWPSDWNAGNDLHHGNLILGRLALRAGDTETAKAYLVSAAKTHGSPQLNSFGPNMALAKELLERGEKATVLEYLALCGNFWSSGKDTLRNWTATINSGGTPDFGANLSY
ncbi:MAG: tetratricopeptide repeat protein [Thermoanaerobaculales bacterium]